MPVPSLDPSDPWRATHVTRKMDPKSECLTQLKTELQKTVQNINFEDPIQYWEST